MDFLQYEPISHQDQGAIKVLLVSIDASIIHWHDDYELLFVVSGSIDLIGEKNVTPLDAGTLILINAKTLHGIKAKKEHNVCLILQMPAGIFKPYLKPNQHIHFSQEPFTRQDQGEGYNRLVHLLAKIGIHNCSDKMVDGFRQQGRIYEAVALVLEHLVYDKRIQPNGEQMDADNRLVVEAVHYLNEHLSHQEVFVNLYHHLGVSEKTLYRQLKSTLGMTPKGLLDMLRIEQAKQLMKDKNKPMVFILEACGFTNTTTFYRSFKRATGMTPKDYQDQDTMAQTHVAIQGYLTCDRGFMHQQLKHYLESEV